MTFASRPIAAIPVLLLLLCSTVARADQVIYDDSLENGWQDWGVAIHNYSTPNPVHSGSYSVSVDMETAFDLLRINNTPFNSSPYASLSFWINGNTTGGQQLWLRGVASNGAFMAPVALPIPVSNTWTHLTVSLSDLGVANHSDFEGIVFQNRTQVAQPIFLLDDIQLVSIPEPSSILLCGLGLLPCLKFLRSFAPGKIRPWIKYI